MAVPTPIHRVFLSHSSKDKDILADRSKLPPVHPLPTLHRMPCHSLGDKFVGRLSAMWNLYDSLFRDSTTVLQATGVVAGTGGLAKTQLAIEYAHRFGSAYPGGVYWVEADRGIVAIITQSAALRVSKLTQELRNWSKSRSSGVD